MTLRASSIWDGVTSGERAITSFGRTALFYHGEPYASEIKERVLYEIEWHEAQNISWSYRSIAQLAKVSHYYVRSVFRANQAQAGQDDLQLLRQGNARQLQAAFGPFECACPLFLVDLNRCSYLTEL
mmetsp:Transcript_33377/g.54157  ORF Transcript_33377/g.54157 Transcript_33377/m.54157 type:complete len:127 (-) Transcript_33377:781-1161(-)